MKIFYLFIGIALINHASELQVKKPIGALKRQITRLEKLKKVKMLARAQKQKENTPKQESSRTDEEKSFFLSAKNYVTIESAAYGIQEFVSGLLGPEQTLPIYSLCPETLPDRGDKNDDNDSENK